MPATNVNGKPSHEIGQRETLKSAKVCNLNALARKQLIEEIEGSVAEDLGVPLTEDEIKGMDDFSGAAGHNTFINELSRIGVDEQSFRDFIVAGIVGETPFSNLCQKPVSEIWLNAQLIDRIG